MKKALKELIESIEEQEFYDLMQAGLDMEKLPEPKNRDAKTSPDELAEMYAINFLTTHTEGRDTYTFSPKWVLPVGKGNKMSEYPSRSLVTNEMITYWEKRMGETKNVTLRARYADLVFDFLDPKADGRRKFQAARLFSETALKLVEHGQTEYDNFREMIKRGLYLAQLLKDDNLISQYISKLTELSKDDRYVDFAFRLLVLDKALRQKLSVNQLQDLLKNLELYVEGVLSDNKPQPFEINKIAGDLLKHYAFIGDEATAKSLAEKIEKDYRESTYSNSSGILKSSYLGELREMYDDLLQTFPFAKAEVERITAELANISDEIEADMKDMSVEVKFTKSETDQMKALIEHLFVDEDTGKPRPMSSVIQHMIVNFMPTVEAEQLSFEEATKQNPISYIFTQSFIGEDGFNTATLKGLDADRDRHFVDHYAKNLQYTSFLLRDALRRFVDTFSSEDLAAELLASLVFRKDDKVYIERALKAYWEKDYLPASQLFIPLIEDGFRNLHRVNGLPVIQPNKFGGYDYHSIDKFINHRMVAIVFSDIGGDDFQFYIKVILSNVGRMGWNLRHNFAHGINKTALLRPEAADRLMHIIFCLSLIRQNPNSDKS